MRRDGGRNEVVSIIMFEIRAIIQWNKDIKNDVGSWKSAPTLCLKFLFAHVTEWHGVDVTGKWVGTMARFSRR